MGKGEEEGVEVKDTVERVCSVILACRGCFGGVVLWHVRRTPHSHATPPTPTHIHTYTFIHFQFHQPPLAPLSLPHCSPNFICHHLLSKHTLLSSPSHPSVLYPPAPWSPFLWSLSFDPHVSDFNYLWLFPPPHSPPLPFHPLIFNKSYLSPNHAPLPPQAKFCQCFLCSHLTPMPDAATLFHLRY